MFTFYIGFQLLPSTFNKPALIGFYTGFTIQVPGFQFAECDPMANGYQDMGALDLVLLSAIDGNRSYVILFLAVFLNFCV